MIETLKPYPDYGPRVTRLLGSFPSHWDVERAKVLLREVDERSETGTEELLSVSHKTGVTPRRVKKVSMFLAESTVGHKICRPGDVVINTMWAWMAALGVAADNGLVSPSYGVYRPRLPGTFRDQYLDELLRAPTYRDEYLVRSTGITSSRLRLYPDEFLTIPLPIPPREDQIAIERFVAHLDGHIGRFIRSKQALIDALAQRRGAIVREAMEEQDVEEVRIGVASEKIGRPIPREADEVYTPIGMYNRGRGVFHKAPTRGAELGDSSFFWLKEDDLLLSGQFAWEGAVALATAADAGCVASHRYAVLRGKAGMTDSGYLLAFFQTPWGQLLLNHHSRGAAGRNRPLNVGSLMKEKVPLPPLPIQDRIAKLVRQEARLQHAVGRLASVLLEYRTRLVADVVTGKLDVRAAAVGLPEPSEAPALVEMIGLETDDELEELEADEAEMPA